MAASSADSQPADSQQVVGGLQRLLLHRLVLQRGDAPQVENLASFANMFSRASRLQIDYPLVLPKLDDTV